MASSHDDSLALPAPEVLRQIAARQDARAEEIRARRLERAKSATSTVDQRAEAAASMIQRNYRGYRARRALNGCGLDASTRWVEAVKDAKYNNATEPESRQKQLARSSTGASQVRARWKRAGAIAYHAGSDDTSSDSDSEAAEAEKDPERRARRAQRRQQKAGREKFAKTMGLEYFLEMVDHKHRYGSNLRRYHAEWKQSDTHENFFYWLDYGEGKELDLEDRPRKRLDTEQVRYLSREERQHYLATIDDQGRFCWAKDGKPISTTPDFKDSINGIVPADDDTPTWREVTTGVAPAPSPPRSPSSSSLASSSSESLSGISTGSHEDASKYANPELHDARGPAKLAHLSADAVTNHLLRKTTKKNTWIFVADTSCRLYIGIKQSGAFQHSSFLRGARVSAAGLIKIKHGRLRKLSPLSGHYAPPVRNFRAFVRTLRDADADLAECSISRSYAVLLGLEAYQGATRHAKRARRALLDVLHPDEKRRREQAEMDTSQSAEKEREILRREEERAREEKRLTTRLKKTVTRKFTDHDDNELPAERGKEWHGEEAAKAKTSSTSMPPVPESHPSKPLPTVSEHEEASTKTTGEKLPSTVRA